MLLMEKPKKRYLNHYNELLNKFKETVEDIEQSLINDFECINDSDWINGWETNTDEGSIAFDIGYRNGVLYAIKLLKDNKKR